MLIAATRQKHHAFFALVAFIAFYSAFFAPSLSSSKSPIAGDVYAYYIPTYYSLGSLWTNYLYAGYPTFADPQFQTWYPVRAIFAALPHAWNAYFISAYVLASWAIYGYVHKLTRSKLAGLVSGLIYGMNGFMLSYEGYSSILHAAAWTPVLILSLENIRESISGRWTLIGTAAVACLLLSGHPQISLYGLLVAAVYVLALGPSAPAGRWKYFAIALAMAILGVGLTAIQMLPTLQFAKLSVRSEMTFADFVSYSLPIRQIVQTVLPDYYPANFSSIGFFAYVGLVPLLLSVRAAFLVTEKRVALLWLAIAIVSFLLALGDGTPLGHLTYHLPVFNKFRAPVRHFLELCLAVSILAGFAIARLQRDASRAVPTAAMAIAGLALLALLALILVFPEVKFGSLLWLTISIGVSLATIAAFVLVWARRLPPHVLILFLVFNVVSFGWSLQQWSLSVLPTTEADGPPAIAEHFREILSATGQRIVPMRGVLGANSGTLDEIPPNTSMRWGVPSISGYGPLIQSRYGTLTGIDNYGQIPGTLLSGSDRTFDILSGRFVFLPAGDERALDPQRWRKVESGAKSVIYENLRAMPKAWFASSVVPTSPEEALQAIKTSKLPDGRPFDPSVTALVEHPVNYHSAGPDKSAQLKVVQYQDARASFRTESNTPQFLVMSDVFYPGWRATVDGQTTELLETDYVLRGVLVPAGRHAVEVTFEPRALVVGKLVSLISLALLAGLCFAVRFSARNAKKPPVPREQDRGLNRGTT